MGVIQNKVYSFLKGGALTDESANKNWRLIIFVVFLLLIMIYSGHRSDSKVIEISALNKEKRKLNATYLDARTTLRKMELESNIREEAKKRGLFPSENPPKKITILKN